MNVPLTVENWFTSPIWKTYLEVDMSDIVPFLYDLKNKDLGQYKSNKGGWASKTLNGIPLAHADLLYKINQYLVEVHKQMGLKINTPSVVTSHWYNINPPNTYNMRHLHPKSMLSGTFYVQVPEGDCGSMTLYRDNLFMGYLPDEVVETWNPVTSGTVTIPPVKGMLLIFPGWLEHDVSANFTSEDRISFSFNTEIRY
jgi:uncharacterized protein (TIGR02466 family)